MLRPILFSGFLLLFIQLAHQQATTAKGAPVIETTLGKIRGNVLTSRKGRDIYAYRGIHYGKAPTGLRRFAAPEPIQPWNDTLDALTDGPACPQSPWNEPIDEDCLSLNVYTANTTASNPVIVYIHGGGNILGSPHSEYAAGPQYLLDEDIVLVGVYFRLGAFGFLSTGTSEAPGNYGYLDQVLALEWVKQHIENFGGNPNRVTLFGQSSGSIAVTLHLASPLSAGLFHGAIALSASATSNHQRNNAYWSRKLAHELSCPKYDTKYLLNCLRQVSWQQIVDVSARWEIYGLTNLKWDYEVDGKFLVEDPNEAIRSNRFNRVPVIAGITRNEFDLEPQKLKNISDLLDDINNNFGLYTPDMLTFESTGNDDERAKSIRQFYYNSTSINQHNLEGFSLMESDCRIGHTVHRLVELAKNYTNIYYYRFDYIGERSRYLHTSAKPQGVYHGDDLIYLLRNNNFNLDDNSTDVFMIDRMTKLFSSFAANGTPPRIENITWPPFTANNSVVLYMDKYPYTGNPFYVDRYALWDKLFPLKESSAAIQLPAIVLFLLAAVWNVLL